MAIQTKRAYEEPSIADGFLVLVDRLWPRGFSKDAAKIDLWNRDVAPSTELREWFGHDPRRWDKFVKRYFAQLDRVPKARQPLVDRAQQGFVTLLYAAMGERHNNAVALRRYLEEKCQR